MSKTKLKYKKLSTAIKAGMKLRPYKIKQEYFDDSNGACTLGCAAVANKIRLSIFSIGRCLDKIYPVLTKYVKHPVATRQCLTNVRDIINDLNDYLGWKRSRIVRWIEKIEKENKK